MRKYLIGLLLLFSSCFLWSNTTDPWSKQDVVLEAAYQITLLVDWKQTSTFHKYTWDKVLAKTDPYGHPITYEYQPNLYRIKEINPFLPAYPKQRTINAACIGSSIGHIIITHYLPANTRVYWQGITVGGELLMLYQNYSIGVRIAW